MQGKRPSYYTLWAFTHNLSDTITVTKMITDTDIPDGYEGYLFETGTITRAVVWNDTGGQLCIQTSGNADDYVRIARSTKISEAEVSPIGTDYGGVGWARCFDDDACSQEDATAATASDIWSSDWDDQTGNDSKYCLQSTVTDEPIIIWADHDKIVLTSS